MKEKNRKVKFYTLSQNINGGGWEPAEILEKVLAYTYSKRIEERVLDLDDSKFCYIDNLRKEGQTLKVVFKSAKRGYLPNVINRQTMQERDNPRSIDEGETEKTHLIMRLTKNELFLLLEVNGLGISIHSLENYFKLFIRKFLQANQSNDKVFIDYEILGKEDFLEELKKMSRVVSSVVFVEKEILGSSFLNFSDRTTPVQHLVEVQFKAKRKDSISHAVSDTFTSLAGGKSKIRKIRVKGKDQANNDVTVSTAFIEKTANIPVDINIENGVISTYSVFSQLMELADSL